MKKSNLNLNKKIKTTRNSSQNKSSKTMCSPIVHEEKNSLTRLNKYIGDSGYCSRREADKLIEQGLVKVNSAIAKMGDKVSSQDKIYVKGKLIYEKEDYVYIALNKPVGIICTTEHKVKNNIADFVNHERRIFPIGRLDKDSQGLIFLTNDGDIVNKILRSGNNHEKEYLVTVDKPITKDFINRMSKGIPILGTITKDCYVHKESKYVFRIILTQGLNRQIRRMCEYLDYNVVKLERIRIMNVTLGNLPLGQWRNLTFKELEEINTLIKTSVKTLEGSQK